MEEKKFDVVVVFGADAVSEYVEAWDNNEQISEGRLEELGCVVRRSFKTEAEKKPTCWLWKMRTDGGKIL